MADRHDGLAYLQIGGPSQGGDREIGEIDPQHGQVGQRVAAINSASVSRPSVRVTWMDQAPLITCSLVTIRPLASMMNPVPTPPEGTGRPPAFTVTSSVEMWTTAGEMRRISSGMVSGPSGSNSSWTACSMTGVSPVTTGASRASNGVVADATDALLASGDEPGAQAAATANIANRVTAARA